VFEAYEGFSVFLCHSPRFMWNVVRKIIPSGNLVVVELLNMFHAQLYCAKIPKAAG